MKALSQLLSRFLAGWAMIPMVVYPQFAWTKTSAHATEYKPIAKLALLINREQTMGQFYDAMEKHMHPKQKEHFLAQMDAFRRQTNADWRSQKMPLKLQKVEDRTMHFLDREAGRGFRFEIVNQGDVFARLNGRELTRAEFENPKLFWDKISAYGLEQRSFSLWSLLIPQAHAFGLMGMLAIGGLLFGGLYLWNNWDNMFGGGHHHHHGCNPCQPYGRHRGSRY